MTRAHPHTGAAGIVRAVAITLLVVGSASCGTSRRFHEAAIRDAAAFLWSKQGADGGWHSETHGLLKGGQALTPFVLHALSGLRGATDGWEADRFQRGIAFIRQHTNGAGILGLSNPDLLEYPNYATAYALRVLLDNGDPRDEARIRHMADYLTQQQFVENRGVAPAHPAYGGWGFGETRLAPGQTGHVDLAHTRRALQALREAGTRSDRLYADARTFLHVVQKWPADAARQPLLTEASTGKIRFDGGFYYSPVVLGSNKGGVEQPDAAYDASFRSYATATCDGILALIAAGVEPQDNRMEAARRWLERHPLIATPEGIPADSPIAWDKVMFFYHLAVRAEAYRAISLPGSWRDTVVDIVIGEQHGNGSFANPDGAPNKEDDPILATALALSALLSAR